MIITGLDERFEKYISFATEEEIDKDDKIFDLKKAIVKGIREQAGEITRTLLKEKDSLSIINDEIIPALNEVGDGFEKKKIYLPSLLMSAEAAGVAFEVIKSSSAKSDTDEKLTVVLATVKGDIHDIGKNIVKLLLENYGFKVVDLGKDVSPQLIAEEVSRLGADLVGLSALMTTTLPSMEESIKLIKRLSPKTKIMVGGAVLTPEYAKEIGADYYGKDAMDAVKIANNINKR